MTLLALIAALVIEQIRPAGRDNIFTYWFTRYADYLQQQLNAGEEHHGIIAWVLAIVPIIFINVLIYFFLYRISGILAWIWNVVILYVTMGFRQFSHSFTAITETLRRGDISEARTILSVWRGESCNEFNENEIIRVAIEQGLLCSHRHVFGIIFWFIILPGPTGAILYRAAALLNEKWGKLSMQDFGYFGKFTAKIFEYIDWLPARLTAVSFAIVGDFEDAIYCWRSQALNWMHKTQGIILASGAGALGVRLGDPLHEYGSVSYRPELGTGDEADLAYMQSTVGLIWRALVLWMLILLLLTLANWVGS